MTLNTNTSPYYDDFDESKNFHRILFKPGYSVQARELTQLQTILTDQIAKFGSHIFAQGSVVIPGNTTYDLSVPYIKVEVNTALSTIVGKTIVNDTTNGTAVVKHLDTSDPTHYKLYIAYMGGSGANRSTFADGDEFYLQEAPAVKFPLLATNAIGLSAMAYVHKGVYFVNGYFVYTDNQSVVLSDDIQTTPLSCRVVFKITEKIVSASDDETLLDPAQGSYNFAAPGADRLAVTLDLMKLDLAAPITDDYIELIRFNGGVLELHKKNAKYSELAKEFARRTFDESGNYIVNGFETSLREFKKTKFNDGVSNEGSVDKYVVTVDSGKAYINGYETETIKRSFVLDKHRESELTKLQKAINYGRYIIVTDVKQLPNINQKEEISFYSSTDASAGSFIGTAKAISVDLLKGDTTSSTAEYKIFITDLSFDDTSNVGSISYGAGGVAKVIHSMSTKNQQGSFTPGTVLSSDVNGVTHSGVVNSVDASTGTIYVTKNGTNFLFGNGNYVTGTGGTATILTRTFVHGTADVNSLLFSTGRSALKTLRTKNPDDSDGDFDIEYSTNKFFKIETGSSTYTITDGTFFPLESGNFFAFNSAGVVDIDDFVLTAPNVLQYGNPVAVNATSAIYIIASVEKHLTPKVKTLQTGTLAVTAESYIRTINLGKADIYRIVSIIDAAGVDVSDRFTLDNGQRDFVYELGSLKLNGVKPTTNLTVNFEYFTHSGTGDFLCADSYLTLGEQYLKKIPTFQSQTTTITYRLAETIDFRPRVNDAGTLASGASISEPPINSTFFLSELQYYVSRIDTIVVDQNAVISIVPGIPAVNPAPAPETTMSLALAYMLVPPYCTSIDEILLAKSTNRGYKMKDIARLEQRLSSVEEFATLSQIESSLLSYEVKDDSGLNRFKSGYLVDNFTNPFTVCDFYNESKKASFEKFRLSSSKEAFSSQYAILDTSSNYTVNNGVLTMAYTETPLVTQDKSSRVTNVNPFLVFDWNGVMTITPDSDNWVDKTNLAPINNNITNTIVIPREEVILNEVITPIYVDVPNYVEVVIPPPKVDPPTIITTLPVTDTSKGGIVSSTPGNTSESGAGVTFQVCLSDAPTSNVTVTVRSSDPTEGSVSPDTLTFTPANWGVNQPVYVTGVEDTEVDGTQTYEVILTGASSDNRYTGVISRVTIRNEDNDSSSIGIKTNVTSLLVSEHGTSASINVRLGTMPAANVTVTATSTDTTESTVVNSTLTFTASNWNTDQTIIVRGVNDDIKDGDIIHKIQLLGTSLDSNYNNRITEVTVTTEDNESTAAIVVPSSITTDEAGSASAKFNVKLSNQPTAPVTITVATSDSTEGEVNPTTLTFTESNWGVNQEVSVSGKDDALADGNVAYTILLTAASSDANYSGKTASIVALNLDDDTPNIIASVASRYTSENGTIVPLNIQLSSLPTASVTVNIVSSNTSEGTVNTSPLTFTTGNWNTAQQVLITGVNDNAVDGNTTYTVTVSSTSSDPNYNGLSVVLDMTNTDNDTGNAGIDIIGADLFTGETTSVGPATVVFTTKLSTQPSSTVTLAVASTNTDEGTVSPSTLTFTTGNWNTPQSVTVTSVNDSIADGDITYSVTLIASSADAGYHGKSTTTVIKNIDDDTSVGITINGSDLSISEAGDIATFNIYLTAAPKTTSPVTVALRISNRNSTEPIPASLSVSSMTFTNANWNAPQAVIVTGIDNAVVQTPNPYNVYLTAVASSSDAVWNGVQTYVTLTQIDNDVPSIVTDKTVVYTTEGGAATTLAVSLSAAPSQNVVVYAVATDTTEHTTSPGNLTFTSLNWNVPQAFTITPVEDQLVDGAVASSIYLTTSSLDLTFNGLSKFVQATNNDNDTAQIIMQYQAGQPTILKETFNGSPSSYLSVVLSAAPSNDVIVYVDVPQVPRRLTVHKPGSALNLGSRISMTFTTSNWNTIQGFEVRAIDDMEVNGTVTQNITATANSNDPNYAGKTANVAITIEDNEIAGNATLLWGIQSSNYGTNNPLSLPESGGTVTYWVKLGSRPARTVSVNVYTDGASQFTLFAGPGGTSRVLTYTPDTWDTPQIVTVTAQDDTLHDGDFHAKIYFIVQSADPNYNFTLDEIRLTILDNDAVTNYDSYYVPMTDIYVPPGGVLPVPVITVTENQTNTPPTLVATTTNSITFNGFGNTAFTSVADGVTLSKYGDLYVFSGNKAVNVNAPPNVNAIVTTSAVQTTVRFEPKYTYSPGENNAGMA